MSVGKDGRLAGTRFVHSPNCDARPDAVQVWLLLLHSISLPPGVFGGDAIERLFTNRLDAEAHPYFRAICTLRVSSHFLVRRDGALVQFVPVQARAWHAGVSRWRGRSRCNDFSVGVELEGTDDGPFTGAQYEALAWLVASLRRALPLREVGAHSDVAAGRKRDPGSGFEWPRFFAALLR